MSSTPRERRGRSRALVVVLLLLIAAAFGWRFHVLGQEETLASVSSVQAAEGMPVEVAVAQREDLERWLTMAGTVEGRLQTAIVSTNSIQVERIEHREGERVEAGQVILRLRSDAPNPMLHSTERARAVYEDALREARRMRALFAEGAVSRQALDKTEMALEVAASDLSDARGGSELVAPHAGVITSVLVEEGDYVDSGAPLAYVARTDSVRIVFEAGSQQALELAAGQRAVWFSEALQTEGEGHVSRLDLMADPHTHLLEGEALFPNPDGRLVPGLLMSFRVQVRKVVGATTVPAACVVRTNDEPAVYAVQEDGDGRLVARLVPVRLGLITTDRVEVREGLSPGARVVLFGQSKLRDGMPVKVIEAEEGA